MRSFLYCFIPILFLVACTKKDSLKKPVSLDFKIDIDRSYNGPGDLVFQKGGIVLAAVAIKGKRSEGDDIDFYRSFDTPIYIDFDSVETNTQLHFDLPQGNYTELTVTCFSAATTSTNNLTVEGLFTPPDAGASTRTVLFEVDLPATFALETEALNSESLAFKSEQPKIATIKLYPLKWFRPVLAQSLNNAQTRTIDNKTTIPINKSENLSIFNVVINRIDKENKVIF